MTAAYGLRRTNGQWALLGSGFNAAVSVVKADPKRGRVYFGGSFTTANGVTVNGICYWNGTTFVAMGGATKGVAGGSTGVRAIAIAPNGDVWVGGDFTSAGGSTADGLARWNNATDTWTVFTNGTPGDIIFALAIDSQGNVYGGGAFINWDGNANEDRIWKYNGSVFSALGTGMNEYVSTLEIDSSDNLYAGGLFTTAGGTTVNYIAKWNGSAWSALSSGMSAEVFWIFYMRNGNLAVGGNFTTAGGVSASRIAIWNGSTFYPLGSGVNGSVTRIVERDNGNILAAGGFSTAGNLTTTDRLAEWNGSTWTNLDCDFPGSPTVYFDEMYGNLYIGFTTTGAATVSGLTTVTNNGTERAYPVITIVGPSSASATLIWLENQSTGQIWYTDLVILSGEVITLDTFTGRVTSDWRGLIFDQPLEGSSAFWLQPGANTIACLAINTITAMTITLNWQPRHLSVEGVAG
jgi:hypothetical protein